MYQIVSVAIGMPHMQGCMYSLHVHYPTQDQIYSEYQNNIKGQGQRHLKVI